MEFNLIFYLVNGNQLAGTQADAKALDKDFTQIDIPTDKLGLMSYINDIMRVKDSQSVQNETYEPEPVILPARYADVTLTIDEEWENLPLARKLHFAALACETAREILRGP
jgi:hypothetical protein